MKLKIHDWRDELIQIKQQDRYDICHEKSKANVNPSVLVKGTFSPRLIYQFATEFIANLAMNIRAGSKILLKNVVATDEMVWGQAA